MSRQDLLCTLILHYCTCSQLNCVQAFYDDPVQSENVQLQLKSCADLERIIQKVLNVIKC